MLDKKNAAIINGADNNFDNKNTYTKVDLNFYNIIDANTGANNRSDTKDASGTNSIENNANNKNAYTKVILIFTILRVQMQV